MISLFLVAAQTKLLYSVQVKSVNPYIPKTFHEAETAPLRTHLFSIVSLYFWLLTQPSFFFDHGFPHVFQPMLPSVNP